MLPPARQPSPRGSVRTSGSFPDDGYTVGPYGGVKSSEHLQLDGLIAYTYSDYDNRWGSTKGDISGLGGGEYTGYGGSARTDVPF